jgi:hypothetical protein
MTDFSLSLNISKKEWLSQPAKRWNEGLEKAGVNFRQRLQISHYPPIPPNSTYTRTGNTAKVAGSNITKFGERMTYGSMDYLQFLLMPAKSVKHWAGKKEEVFKAMQDGFRAGVRDFKG